MILRLAVLCEDARERPDGRLDLVGVFNELSAPGFPALQESMTFVLIVEWGADESGEQPIRADLVDAGGRKLLTIQGHTQVDARPAERAPAQTRLLMPLRKVIFPRPGRYRFDVVAGSDVAEACTFFVGEVAS